MFGEGSIEWENKMIDEQMEYDRAMQKQQESVMRDYEYEHDVNRLNGLLNEANEQIEALNQLIKDARDIAFSAPELNMSSYSHEQVGQINAAMDEIFTMLNRGA